MGQPGKDVNIDYNKLCIHIRPLVQRVYVPSDGSYDTDGLFYNSGVWYTYNQDKKQIGTHGTYSKWIYGSTHEWEEQYTVPSKYANNITLYSDYTCPKCNS